MVLKWWTHIPKLWTTLQNMDSNPNYSSWIMNIPQRKKIKFSRIRLHTSWFPQAQTNNIQQNYPYILTRTTSQLSFTEWTPTSKYKYGIALSHMQTFRLIYYNNPGCNQNYYHTHTSIDIATTTIPPSLFLILVRSPWPHSRCSGLEFLHPIMNTLWGHGDRTKIRNKNKL